MYLTEDAGRVNLQSEVVGTVSAEEARHAAACMKGKKVGGFPAFQLMCALTQKRPDYHTPAKWRAKRRLRPLTSNFEIASARSSTSVALEDQ
jgi:sRNA-binding protein